MHYQTPGAHAASGISHAKQEARNYARLYWSRKVEDEEGRESGRRRRRCFCVPRNDDLKRRTEQLFMESSCGAQEYRFEERS